MTISYRKVVGASVAVCVLAAGCNRGSSPESAANRDAQPWLAMEPLTLPVNEPAIAPQLTRTAKGTSLSWVVVSDKGSSTLRFAEWDGAGWSTPLTAASGNDWFLSSADVPSVLRLSNGTLVADWFVNTRPEIEAYDLLLSYSKDNGRTWVKPFKPHQDKTQTQHGFASLVEMPDQGVGMVWLDGRDMENNTTDPEGGVMTIRFTSFDRNWTPGADVAVNTRVCECCQTAAVVTDEGVVTAFRDRSDKEIRDIAVSRLDKGAWTPATLVHADNYESFACPVNGPALSARGKTLAIAWYTVLDKTGHAFAAFSQDAGRTWSAPARLDDAASLGMVDIELLDDGSAAATWVEFTDGKRHFMVRQVKPNGDKSRAVDVAGQETGRVSGYPRLVRNGDALVFAWAEGSPENEGSGQTIKGALARLAN